MIERIPPDAKEKCLCDLDESTGLRLGIMCPRHDGQVIESPDPPEEWHKWEMPTEGDK